MFFPKQYPAAALASWSRALRMGLSAGLSIEKVFSMQAKKGPSLLRPVAATIVERIARGDSIRDAIRPYEDRFPALFTSMIEVGEITGHLPEIFKELEEYYQSQHTLKKRFRAEMTLPVIQLIAAVGIIAVTILILGLIGGDKPIAPIGMGLTGPRGAIVFLGVVTATAALLWFAWIRSSRNLKGQAGTEAMLLRVPGLGACLYALAMTRLCMGLRLTLNSSLDVRDALRYSLRATANAAFLKDEPAVIAGVRSGGDIYKALSKCKPLSEEFLGIVMVGETSGELPESMGRQAEFYREEAERKMQVTARMAGFGIWAMVAILIIVAIFRMAMVYVDALNGS